MRRFPPSGIPSSAGIRPPGNPLRWASSTNPVSLRPPYFRFLATGPLFVAPNRTLRCGLGSGGEFPLIDRPCKPASTEVRFPDPPGQVHFRNFKIANSTRAYNLYQIDPGLEPTPMLWLRLGESMRYTVSNWLRSITSPARRPSSTRLHPVAFLLHASAPSWLRSLTFKTLRPCANVMSHPSPPTTPDAGRLIPQPGGLPFGNARAPVLQ